MGRVEDYWNNLRLLRAGQYVASVPQFTQYDIDLARSLGIELNQQPTKAEREK